VSLIEIVALTLLLAGNLLVLRAVVTADALQPLEQSDPKLSQRHRESNRLHRAA
jgi:hypothetical protein